jgi:RNA exonuclease 1
VRTCGRGGQGAVRAAVVGHGNPGVMHGAKAIRRGTDQEVLDCLIQTMSAQEFVFRQFMDNAEAMGCECASLVCGGGGLIAVVWTADVPVVVTPPTKASPEALATAQVTLDAQLVTLYASLPARTAAVIFTGHSDGWHRSTRARSRSSRRSRAGRRRRKWIDPSDGERWEGVGGEDRDG